MLKGNKLGIDLRNAKPLYHQIIDDIQQRVKSGNLKVGDQIGSQNELAKEYNVSLITVKKALSELIKEGILYSRVGKGTYVASQNPKSQNVTTRTIGLVLQDMKSPFFSLIAQEAENIAFQRGYSIFFSNVSGQLEKEESQISQFRQMGVSGLIIASMTHVYYADEMIRKLHNEGFPYVMVSYIHDPDIYFVGTNHEYGGYIATGHLIEGGYKRISYINGEEGNLVGELRYQGYVRALTEHGREVNDKYVYRLPHGGEWYDFTSGYEMGKIICKLSDRPDAVFLYNDLAALGFQRAILEFGLRIPEDMAIVGFDDIDRASYARVPLTTVKQPIKEIADQAIENILKRKNKEYAPVKTILNPELVVRNSTMTDYKKKNVIGA
jgi:DNA-binding LacI/PurR family transcriptional regulator